MSTRTLPSGPLIVASYALFAAAIAGIVVARGGPDLPLYLLIGPIPLASLFYRRWVFMAMGLIAALTAAGCVMALYAHPDRSLWTIGTVTSIVLAVCELLHRLIHGRLQTEEELRRASTALEALVHASPLATFAIDETGRVTTWNAAAARIFGWRKVEVLGHPLPVVVDEPNHAASDFTRWLLQDPPPRDVEARCRTRDGRLIEVSISPARLAGAEGAPGGAMAVVADVTARKQAEENARRLNLERSARAHAESERARLAFLAEASSVLASSLDYEQTLPHVARLAVPYLADWCCIDLLNPEPPQPLPPRRIAATSADPASEALAQRLQAALDAGDPLEWLPSALRTGRTELMPNAPAGIPAGGEGHPQTKAGESGWPIRSAMSVPLLARGRLLGAITLVTAESQREYGPADMALAEDLARRMGLAVDNALLYGEAQEADHAKDQFLALLAHELRNPLAAIANASYVLEHAAVPDPVAARLRTTISRQSEQISRLVEDLSDISRINRGKIELRRERVELGTLVQRSVEAALPYVHVREHQLNVRLPIMPTWLEADPVRLEQVLGNLLHNAAKYTPPGGRIELLVEPADSVVIIRVRDTGIGIPPDLLPRVFDLFVQAELPAGQAQGGLGLGLTLVRSLVQLHGGSVEAQSAGAGRGSEFIIRLPVAAEDLEGEEPPGIRGLPREGAAETDSRRILVVDDNPDAAETLADALRTWGHQAWVAADGTAALELAREHLPEVVLLDLGLPGMDGFELARQLREERPGSPTRPTFTLVAVTGYSQEAARQRTQEAGFDRHLVKPVDLGALRELLQGSLPSPLVS
jgi:PAS domain S-box-containing protein